MNLRTESFNLFSSDDDDKVLRIKLKKLNIMVIIWLQNVFLSALLCSYAYFFQELLCEWCRTRNNFLLHLIIVRTIHWFLLMLISIKLAKLMIKQANKYRNNKSTIINHRYMCINHSWNMQHDSMAPVCCAKG